MKSNYKLKTYIYCLRDQIVKHGVSVIAFFWLVFALVLIRGLFA